jgi:hypothetical protein
VPPRTVTRRPPGWEGASNIVDRTAQAA